MASIQCSIVSAERDMFSGEIDMLVANGSLGELGIVHGHAPLLTILRPGPVRIIFASGEEEVFYVSGGFLEVQRGAVSILADTAIRADDVDEAAAEEARREAEVAMENQAAELDYGRASAQLAEAVAQLAAVKKKRGLS